jgi:dipeptidase D
VSLSIEKMLPDNAFWKYFLMICSIPHPSGYEEKLREALIAEAEKHHLKCRVDAAGNLAIDRAAAPGHENTPLIIMQAHLDMVPQAADGVEFDFQRESITPVIEDGWVTTGNRTTLGADDGAGVALAMELLTDPTLQCGALRGVFTVSEETGLGGAEDIDQSFLDGKYLINLDSDEPFTIGCAGGARFDGSAELDFQADCNQNTAVKITLCNLLGGHSGEDIHKNVGSATKIMADFLIQLQKLDFSLAKVDAGTLHNAIARSAVVYGVIPAEKLEQAKTLTSEYAVMLNNKYEKPSGSSIVLTLETVSDRPDALLTLESQKKLLHLWNDLPHGLLEKTPDGASQTSCNLAVLCGEASGKWTFTLLARSIYNHERDQVVNAALALLKEYGFSGSVSSAYSSWEPKWESEFLEYACRTAQQITGRKAQKNVIHGGLEPGMFCGMNPQLEMISFAPHTLALHSPQERMEISSAEESRQLLRKLIEHADQI